MAGSPRLASRVMRFLARIWIRLLAFNVLLVFLPAAGLLYLNTYERQLLAAQEREMVQQGRLLAAALAASDRSNTWYAEQVLQRLHRRHQARLRVIDIDGSLLADSSMLGPKREPDGTASRSVAPGARGSALYRLGALPFRLYRKVFPRSRPKLESSADYYSGRERLLGQEVLAALAGRYGATTRISEGQQSVTLYTAIPVQWDREILGAVLVSQSTFGILEMLDAVRLDIARVVLASLVVAAILSFLVSATIARPLSQLSVEASQIVDDRGRLKRTFGGSKRRDEIGDLSRALEHLTERLRDRVEFIETFASDVSHEFKNPLASIRAASELLSDVGDAEERTRMIGIVTREVGRMERLLTGVRDVTRIDAEGVSADDEEVDVAELVTGSVTAARQRSGATIYLEQSDDLGSSKTRGTSERLEQVFANLLDNATSFAPVGTPVTVELAKEEGFICVSVSDEGAGVPEEHRERVFDRFFTFRPESNNGAGGAGHVGLGLSIAQAIVRSHGGEITLETDRPSGVRFEVRLPLI